MTYGTAVGRIFATLELDDQLDRGLLAAKTKFASFISSLEGQAAGLGSKLSSGLLTGARLIGSGSVAIAAATAAALGAGTKAYADFEQGLASVAKTTGLTGKELDALGGQLRKLATAGPVTVEEFEKIAAAAGSLGIGAEKMARGDLAGAREEIVNFSKTMSDMAIAFEMDVETVSDSMASIGNVYKIHTEDLGYLGSQINVLENTMKATAPQIIEFLNAFGGTATMFGESAAKTAAFGATLSELGVTGAEASTQIRSGVLQLTQTSKDGQKNIAAMAKLMGISTKELTRMLNEDLYGTLIKMGKAFQSVQGDTEKAALAQQIFGTYGYSAMIKLGNGADIYTEALKRIVVKGDELQKESATMANTVSGQWKRMMNGLNDIGISIGNITKGPLKDFLAVLNDQAIPATKQWVELLANGDYEAVFEQIKSVFERIVSYIENIDWFGAGRQIGSKIIDALKAIFEEALNIGGWIHDHIARWIGAGEPERLGESIVESIAGAITSWLNGDYSIWDALKSVWGTAAEWLKLGYEIIKGIASGIIQKVKYYLTPAQNQFLDFVKSIGDAFFGLGDQIAQAIGGALDRAQEAAAHFVEWLAHNVPGVAAALSAVGVGSSSGGGVSGTTSSGGSNAGRISTMTQESGSKKYVVWLADGSTFSTKNFEDAKYISEREMKKAQSGTVYTSSIGQHYYSGDSKLASVLAEMRPSSLIEGYTDEQVAAMKQPINSAEVIEKWTGSPTATHQVEQTISNTYSSAGKAMADSFSETVDKNFKLTFTPISKTLTGLNADAKKTWDEFIENQKWVIEEEKTSTVENIAKQKAATDENTSKMGNAADTICGMWKNAAEMFKNSAAVSGETLQAKISSAAQNALNIGQEISSKFTNAGNAVKVGIDAATGKLTAYIGSAGSKLSSDIISGATQAKSALQSGGSSVQSALSSGASAISSAVASLGRVGSSAWGGSFYTGNLFHAAGTIASGPELAVIGEEGKEYVIPTKRKRWDLLLAAMRDYGIRGFAEGGSVGASVGGTSDAEEMNAYFGIRGLASMSKQVQKIINDLKDFFRITWGIIKSEGAVYWKQIENVILSEVTLIRDNSWQAALDIRNQWISSTTAIRQDVVSQYAAMWPEIKPSITDIHDGILSSFEDARGQVNMTLENMISDANTQFSVFQNDWSNMWSKLLADLQNTTSQISAILSQLGAQLSNINVNASVNLSSYGGGGMGGFEIGGSSGGGSAGGGGNDWSSTPTTFTDTTCLGDVVTVNALKYTSPSGVVTYINPLSGNFHSILAAAEAGTLGSSSGSYAAKVSVNGGVSSWIDSGNWSFWAAQGALLDDGPKRIIAGEKGPELILPAKLTRMFMQLADIGLGTGNTGKIVIEDHTEHKLYIDGKQVTDIIMSRAVQKMRLKGAMPVK